MKSNVKQSNREAAFTIVELLTVMSIIVILIGLLVPALNQVKRYAYEVKQRAQLKSIDTALELFNSEFDGYPDSDAKDPDNVDYCGAMKLCEAVMGRDLMGFHPDSIFRSSGIGSLNNQLYPPQTGDPIAYNNSLSARKGPYLPLDNANAYQLRDLYTQTGPFLGENFVLCDVFRRVTHLQSGKKVGMPILYYKANTARRQHDYLNPANPQNIYDYTDNDFLVRLGKPFDPPPGGEEHRLTLDPGNPAARGYRFYMNTTNDKVLASSTAAVRPYRSDTFILISAGNDGEYGTPDDITNFDWRYREQP
jgi:type II secretory pathway pseudopilin PulG